jgi:hypothetical protein
MLDPAWSWNMMQGQGVTNLLQLLDVDSCQVHMHDLLPDQGELQAAHLAYMQLHADANSVPILYAHVPAC